MDSSDEDEADIDKDDDVKDSDYVPGKDTKESHSEDEYDEEDDEGLSEEESLDAIKTKLKEKFSNNTTKRYSKNVMSPISKTPNNKIKANYSTLDKENFSPSYSPLNSSGLKDKLSQFSSPQTEKENTEESTSASINEG